MRICYVLLSPTCGMHQYMADLANRMAQFDYDVHLVTTARYPGHRYLPAITVHTPVDTRSSGLSPDTLQPAAMRRTAQVIQDIRSDVVHMTGPHLWNIPPLWTRLWATGCATMILSGDTLPSAMCRR